MKTQRKEMDMWLEQSIYEPTNTKDLWHIPEAEKVKRDVLALSEELWPENYLGLGLLTSRTMSQ